MKRAALVFVALALCNASSLEAYSFGVKAGFIMANTTETPAGWMSSSFKNGFAGGVSVEYPFTVNLSLQPELLYVSKGQNGGIATSSVAIDFTSSLGYIEIPILAKLTMATRSSFRPCFFVGPSIGINIGADLDIEGEYLSTGEHFTGSADYSDVVNRTELGFVFGLGFGYAAGPGVVTLDGRFNLGLTKVYKGGTVMREIDGEEITETVYEGESKNIGFALLLGYAF